MPATRNYQETQERWRRNDWILILSMILFLVLIALASTQARCQTISPVISEAKGPRVRGEIALTNNQIVPMSLVIEPQSMSVTVSGQSLYRALDPGIIVKLDSTSARLGPKQQYTVGYQITCPTMPCVLNLAAIFTGLRTRDGLAVALHVGNVIFICEKQKGCRDSVRHSWGLK